MRVTHGIFRAIARSMRIQLQRADIIACLACFSLRSSVSIPFSISLSFSLSFSLHPHPPSISFHRSIGLGRFFLVRSSLRVIDNVAMFFILCSRLCVISMHGRLPPACSWNPSSYDTLDKIHCFTASVDPAFYRVRRRTP